jgi:hypothetical protein
MAVESARREPAPPKRPALPFASPPMPRALRKTDALDAPSNHRPAIAHFPRSDPPRRRAAADGAAPSPPPSPPIAPPWPELARRDAEGRAARPPAAAPWPELLAGDEQETERSFEELERAARLDALAARLGEEPWNASPS